jgi:hypothetical protein
MSVLLAVAVMEEAAVVFVVDLLQPNATSSREPSKAPRNLIL